MIDFTALDGTVDTSWGPNNRFRFPLHGGTGRIWTTLASRLPAGLFQPNRLAVRIDTDRARDDVPPRMFFDVLFAQKPGVDQRLHIAVIVSQLGKLAVAKPVGARIACPQADEFVCIGRQHHHRRSHRPGGRERAAAQELGIRPGQRVLRGFRQRVNARTARKVPQRPDHEAARDVAGRMSAHAVGHSP